MVPSALRVGRRDLVRAPDPLSALSHAGPLRGRTSRSEDHASDVPCDRGWPGRTQYPSAFGGGRFVVEAHDPPRAVEEYLSEIWERFGGKTLKQLEALVDRDGAWRPVFRKGPLLEIPAELLYRAYGGGADAVPLDRRSSAGKNRNKEQEYWTLTGKKAEKWTPGLPSGAAANTARKKPANASRGTGVRRILSAEEAQGRNAAAKTPSR